MLFVHFVGVLISCAVVVFTLLNVEPLKFVPTHEMKFISELSKLQFFISHISRLTSWNVEYFMFACENKHAINVIYCNLALQKDLFLKLISVKGIGCKSACTMLASGDVEGICEAIESGNMTYLKKIPGIGPKAAGQIILDLQGKVTATKQTVVNQELEEAMEVLIALGYKQSEVDKVVKKLTDENLDTNGYVKKALSLIVK